jgi:DNA-binding transcriptional MerR regulator
MRVSCRFVNRIARTVVYTDERDQSSAEDAICHRGARRRRIVSGTTLGPDIARGLLNGPAKGGRVPEYTVEHVVRLERIKRLQADGHTPLEVGRILSGSSAKPTIEPPTAWWQHAIADDVIVEVQRMKSSSQPRKNLGRTSGTDTPPWYPHSAPRLFRIALTGA